MTRVASLADLQDVLALQKTESNRVGFLPKMALRQHIERGWCIVVLYNGDCVGYILGWWRLRYAPWCRAITHLVTRRDLRRCGLARLLVQHYARLAMHAGQVALQAWTRLDLHDAHAFFKRMRWTAIAMRSPVHKALYTNTTRTTARKKPAILYRFSLTAIPHPDFYDRPTRGGSSCGTITTTAIPRPTRRHAIRVPSRSVRAV